MTTERGPQRVGRALDRLMGTLRAPSVDVIGAVFTKWSDIVGDDVAAHTRPVSIDGDELVIAADDPSWASEVRWLEKALLQRVAEVTGSPRIQRVKVRVERRE